jgi:NAD-dependent SIR2 family protein deacetylase
MKRDCPHCHKSMEGKYLRWLKFQKPGQFRSCPLCGGEIEFRLYPEEVGARLLTIVVLIAVLYWGRHRPDGYGKPVAIGAAVLLAMYVVAYLRTRNQQRYKKGRNS